MTSSDFTTERDTLVAGGTSQSGVAAPGWRLPAETRLGSVALQVADLERSLAYYLDVIGLRLIERNGGDASLGTYGAIEPLVRLRELPGAVPVPPSNRLGLYHFAILVPDRPALGRFVAHLVSDGVRFGASDHLVSEALYLRDPDGLGIEVYVDRPRSEWRSVGGQLEMTTEPLDLNSLAKAADGAEWDGLPAGTRIGHVHLHVADLVRSSTFYHDGLGLDKTVWSYPGALFLSAGGYHHHLGLNTWAAGAPPAREADARLLEWEILLPSDEDVRSVEASLAAEGFPSSASGADGCVFHDPAGTPLRVRKG